jgi:hypothetical protein
MARDFIKVDSTAAGATQATKLKDYISSLRIALEKGRAVQAVMNHNQDGSVWTDIETLYGIPAGKGDDVYDLVNGSVGAMEGTFQNDDCQQITEQVG